MDAFLTLFFLAMIALGVYAGLGLLFRTLNVLTGRCVLCARYPRDCD